MTRDIRATRDRLGLSTRELARLVGVEPRTASRWLDGSRGVPEPVWRLLDAVGVIHAMIDWAEGAEEQIDGEWGDCRTMARIYAEQEASESLVAAVAFVTGIKLQS